MQSKIKYKYEYKYIGNEQSPYEKDLEKTRKKAFHQLRGLSVCQKRNLDARAVSASRLMFPCFDFKILRI